MMTKYVVTKLTHVSPSICLLTMRPKRPGRALSFYAGQYAAISFWDGWRPTPARCFSIISSPTQKNMLQFALRVDGAFTQMMAGIRPGDTATVQGPFGSFVIDEQFDCSIICLAGGIGVTPFVSMARYAADAKLSMPITLLYSCSDAADMPFVNELRELEQRNPRLRVAYFVGKGDTSSLKAPRVVRGRITQKHLAALVGKDADRLTYFLCGPPAFMEAMQTSLSSCGIDQERVIAEAFSQSKQKSEEQKTPGRWTYAFASALVALGVAGIAGLDLVRAVPKLTASAQAATTSASNSSEPTAATTSTPATAATSPAAQTQSPTASSAPPTTTSMSSGSSSSSSVSSPHKVYQPPVSTVS